MCLEKKLPTEDGTNADEIRRFKKSNNFGYYCLNYAVKDKICFSLNLYYTFVRAIQGQIRVGTITGAAVISVWRSLLVTSAHVLPD